MLTLLQTRQIQTAKCHELMITAFAYTTQAIKFPTSISKYSTNDITVHLQFTDCPVVNPQNKHRSLISDHGCTKQTRVLGAPVKQAYKISIPKCACTCTCTYKYVQQVLIRMTSEGRRLEAWMHAITGVGRPQSSWYKRRQRWLKAGCFLRTNPTEIEGRRDLIKTFQAITMSTLKSRSNKGIGNSITRSPPQQRSFEQRRSQIV